MLRMLRMLICCGCWTPSLKGAESRGLEGEEKIQCLGSFG